MGGHGPHPSDPARQVRENNGSVNPVFRERAELQGYVSDYSQGACRRERSLNTAVGGGEAYIYEGAELKYSCMRGRSIKEEVNIR